MLGSKKFVTRRGTRGSPLVEEALLIALAVIGVILVISYVLGLIDWLINWINQSLQNIGKNNQKISSIYYFLNRGSIYPFQH